MAPSTARTLSPRSRKIATTASAGLLVALNAGAGMQAASGITVSEATATKTQEWPAPTSRFVSFPLPRANQ